VVNATERSSIARCDAQFPQAAREFVHSTLETLGLDHVIETADLLVSEVVTYALVAGEFEHAWVEVSVVGDLLRIEVTDPTSYLAAVVSDLPLEHTLRAGGIGLLVVDQAARRWGVEPANDGTTVWFELDLTAIGVPHLESTGPSVESA
jgi:hypothetical protein